MDNYLWTRHSEWKMKQYALSKQRLKRVVRNPDRVEKSIVPGMVAAMQVAGNSKKRYEVWVMYGIKKGKMENGKQINREEDAQSFSASSSLQMRGGKEFSSRWGVDKKERLTFGTLSPVARFREMRRQEFMARNSLGGGKTIRIISAWKYPGESPKRDPIPAEILEEIRGLQ